MKVGPVIVGVPCGIEVVVGTGKPGVQWTALVRLFAVDPGVIVRILAAVHRFAAAKNIEGVDEEVFAAAEVMIECG